jgi:3-ketosteroid 9alpha-monooxygenase subunit B
MATEDSYLLEVAEIVQETADAVSVVFTVPAQESEAFQFKAGQFLTLGIPSDQTGLAARCYSICTPPGDVLAVTVKRTNGGYASNWIADNLTAGDTVRVLPPSGIFTPKSHDVDLLLFAGGSGVTPIMSITQDALKHGTGRIVVFYANRDQESVIFAKKFSELAAEYPDRLQVIHWLESVQGLPSEEQIKAFAAQYDTWTSFCCGPAPFMKMVSLALRALDFPRERRHQEKFVSLGGNPFGDVDEVLAAQATIAEADDAPEPQDEAPAPAVTGPVAVEVELDGETFAFTDWDGTTHLLDYLTDKGVPAPFSCREGECSACACVVLEGDLSMTRNDVLEAEDLADGLRLSCQSKALTEKVRITYNG